MKKDERERILVLVRHPVGGIRTYLKYTYNRLSPEKYAFTIVTIKGAEVDLIEQDLKDFNPVLVRVEGRKLNWEMFKAARRILKRERIAMIHSQGLTAGLIGIAANLASGRPHLVTSHDVFREDQFHARFGW